MNEPKTKAMTRPPADKMFVPGQRVTLHGHEAVIPLDVLKGSTLEPPKVLASRSK